MTSKEKIENRLVPWLLGLLLAGSFSGIGAYGGSNPEDKSAEGSPQATAVSLCAPEESVVFSCGTSNGKVVSICSSPDLAADAGYVQYRFGRIDEKPELTYPATRTHPRGHFKGGTMMYSGGGGAYLKFTVSEYTYAVFTGIGKGWESEGVVVSRSGEQIAHFPCQGPWTSEIGPDWLEQAGIERDPDEADFEIP